MLSINILREVSDNVDEVLMVEAYDDLLSFPQLFHDSTEESDGLRLCLLTFNGAVFVVQSVASEETESECP